MAGGGREGWTEVDTEARNLVGRTEGEPHPSNDLVGAHLKNSRVQWSHCNRQRNGDRVRKDGRELAGMSARTLKQSGFALRFLLLRKASSVVLSNTVPSTSFP